MSEFRKMLEKLSTPVDIKHIDFRVQGVYGLKSRVLAYKDA